MSSGDSDSKYDINNPALQNVLSPFSEIHRTTSKYYCTTTTTMSSITTDTVTSSSYQPVCVFCQ